MQPAPLPATMLVLFMAIASLSSCTSFDNRSLSPRDRADLSFSAIPMGTMRTPESLGLREIRVGRCQEADECDWIDANTIRHYFWEDDELVVKSAHASDFGDNPIPALGVGRARSRTEVLTQIRSFLPEIEVECADATELGAPRDGPGETLCGGTLGEGWFRVWFDAHGILTEIRFDSYQFT